MAASGTLRTIKAVASGSYREKGSKFISAAWPVKDEAEVRSILDETRKTHHDARHHAYAFILGEESSSWRAVDDGEPPGTAGKPILNRIRSHGLTNTLVVVSRYFGGTLLGVSGLINAYKASAESALSSAVIYDHVITLSLEIRYPWPAMNEVMKIIKEENLSQASQHFDLDCSLTVNVKITDVEKIRARLARIEGVKVMPS
jgi:uncharacterized YigZ family protein